MNVSTKFNDPTYNSIDLSAKIIRKILNKEQNLAKTSSSGIWNNMRASEVLSALERDDMLSARASLYFYILL